MTAFARCEHKAPWGELAWELRSVNHRYLDVGLKLPDELRALEQGCRERIAARLRRGRIDGLLRLTPAPATGYATGLDESAVQRLFAFADQLRAIRPELPPLRTIDVLSWPGIIQAPAIDFERLGAAGMKLLDEALDQIVAGRRREGARLTQVLTERLDTASALLANIRSFLPEVEKALQDRLLARIQDIKDQMDANRVEQEVVLLLNKTDVHEEVDRLGVHLDEVRRLLGAGKPIGRRLDFLMQELNREANTLGSKAADTRVTNVSVEMKVLIDQMREQIQNLE